MTTPGALPPGPKHPLTRPTQLPIYQPPTTTEEIVREKDRISLLLEINVILLQYTTGLQTQGQGGILGSQQQHGETMSETKNASEEYIKCMRCLSSNISYLTAVAAMARNRQGTLPGPAIMDPPDTISDLAEPYERLKALFPGWMGLAGPGVAMRPGSIGAGTGAVSAHGMGQAVGQVQGTAQGLPQSMPQNMAQNMAQGMVQGSIHGTAQGTAQGMGYPNITGMSMGGMSIG